MHCNRITLENGQTAIVCRGGRRRDRCRWCRITTPGVYRCDWKLAGRRTCDKHLCAEHADEVGPNKHLCPEHQKAYRAWRAGRAAGRRDRAARLRDQAAGMRQYAQYADGLQRDRDLDEARRLEAEAERLERDE